MNKRKIAVRTIALFCGLLMAGGGVWAMSSASPGLSLAEVYAIHWNVIGGGGGPISSTSYAVDSTVGQPAIGPLTSASYRLGGGYWHGMAETATLPRYTLYLSMISRE